MAITVDGAYYPVIGYSGGVNTFTFNAAAGGAVGDIVIVAVSCHGSIAPFAANGGWNFLGHKRPIDVDGIVQPIGAQVAIYWKVKASGDASYVFNSGAAPAQDVNAKGQMVFVRGAKASFPAIGTDNSDYRQRDIDQMDGASSSEMVSSVFPPSGTILLAFSFSNWRLFNTRQYGSEGGYVLPIPPFTTYTATWNSSDGQGIIGLATLGSNSAMWDAEWEPSGGLNIGCVRYQSPFYGRFEQLLSTTVWFVVKRAKTGGLFGVNH